MKRSWRLSSVTLAFGLALGVGVGPATASEPAALVNLAQGKSARQSSTGYGGEARRAVDGDTNGQYAANSVSHTEEEREPWWEVDLGQVHDIREVRVWNRSDEHSDRLVNFVVLISERPFTGFNLGAALQDPGVWKYPHPGMAGEMTVFATKVRGRYVRVQLRQTNFLALAEVQVLGMPAGAAPAPTWTNLALRKPARQSSTGYGGDARRAVDGVTNGHYPANSVSHTEEQTEPWWEVDLGQEREIGEIRLWNRTDEHAERLANLVVFVSLRPFAAGLATALRDPAVWRHEHAGTVGVSVSIPVRTQGRYIRVQLRGRDFLALAEVEVLGPAAARTEPAPVQVVRRAPSPPAPPATITVRAPLPAAPPAAAPSPGETIEPEKLIADIGRFRARAAAGPAAAWRGVLTEGAFQRLPAVEATFFGAYAPEAGWAYFFHAALYVVCPYTSEVAVACFYHPWSDTALITLWQSRQGRSLLIRADVVPGDLLREPAARKIDLPPLWQRQADALPPLLAVPLAAGRTLRAFAEMFPVEAAGTATPLRQQARDALSTALEDAARRQTLGAVASTRLGKCLDGLQRYGADAALAPYREGTVWLQAQLTRGDQSALSGPEAETLPETRTLLQRLQPQLAGYDVVAIATNPQAAHVFLSHPAEPKQVLALWYETRNEQVRLRRADFIDHDLGVLLGEKLQTLVDAANAAETANPTR